MILTIEGDYIKRVFLESHYMHTCEFVFNDKINCFYHELHKSENF